MALLLNGQGLMYFVMTMMRGGFQSTQTHFAESIQKAFVIAFTCGSVALGSRTFLCPQKMRHSGQQAEEEACLALITVQAGSASAVRCARKEGWLHVRLPLLGVHLPNSSPSLEETPPLVSDLSIELSALLLLGCLLCTAKDCFLISDFVRVRRLSEILNLQPRALPCPWLPVGPSELSALSPVLL